ncbi:hypothetical protein JYT83_00555 [bacterium AH-315-F18]|nr:hypothetical protein [bacterium AH-315-F18]
MTKLFRFTSIIFGLALLAGCTSTPTSPPAGYSFELEQLPVQMAASWVTPSGKIYGGVQQVLNTSTDGKTWTPLANFPARKGEIRTVFVDSRGTVFTSAMGDGKLRMSVDEGQTWTVSLTFQQSYCVAWRMSEADTGQLYVGEYTNGEATGQSITPRVYRSPDGGKTWNIILEQNGSRHCHLVAVDPYIKGRVYASFGDHEKGAALMRSDDYGTNWTLLGNKSSFWQPTAVVFTSEARMWGSDHYFDQINRTENDKDYTKVWDGGIIERDWFWGLKTGGAMFFGSTPGSEEGISDIVGSFDEGRTFTQVHTFGQVPAWRGCLYASNPAPDGWVYCGDATLSLSFRFRWVEK